MSRPTPCTPRFHQVRRKRLFHRFQFPQTSQLNSTPVSNAAANASPFSLDPWIMPYPGRQHGYMPLDECLAASRDLAPSPGPRRKPNTPNIWFKAELTLKTNHSSLQNRLSCGFPPGKSIHPWTPCISRLRPATIRLVHPKRHAINLMAWPIQLICQQTTPCQNRIHVSH